MSGPGEERAPGPSAAHLIGAGRVGGRDLFPAAVLRALAARLAPVMVYVDEPYADETPVQELGGYVEDALASWFGPAAFGLLMLGAVLRDPQRFHVEVDADGEARLVTDWPMHDQLAADVLMHDPAALAAWWDRVLAVVEQPLAPLAARGRVSPPRLPAASAPPVPRPPRGTSHPETPTHGE